MFIIADIEWMTNMYAIHGPTQLSAVKVDENWNTVDSFNAFIRPRDNTFFKWNHVAYTGGMPEDFKNADTAYTVLQNFLDWISSDDIILWWHFKSRNIFNALVNHILKKSLTPKAVIANEYIHCFLGDSIEEFNPYDIAERKGIDTKPYLKHYAENDVRVLRELLQSIEYPQKNFLKPLEKIKKANQKDRLSNNFPLLYDLETGLLHKKDCLHIENTDHELRGYLNAKAPYKKGYKTCSCCKELYQEIIRAHNKKIMKNPYFTYVYTSSSNVYHRCGCHLMENAHDIQAVAKYETIKNTGRVPCKICKPLPSDAPAPSPKIIKNLLAKIENPKKSAPTLSKEDFKAIKRQKKAGADRQRMLSDDNLSEEKIADIYTLTQPSYAFWAGQGYNNFHLHSCPKLHNVSNLKGFSTYSDAVSAGYTPCKTCRPTHKHNANVSIPITSKVRDNETMADIEKLCDFYGYKHYSENELLYLETEVGKWYINFNTVPVKIHHINLVLTPYERNYHKQPRVFLSYTDAFYYIKRHDDCLSEKMKTSIVFEKHFYAVASR